MKRGWEEIGGKEGRRSGGLGAVSFVRVVVERRREGWKRWEERTIYPFPQGGLVGQ